MVSALNNGFRFYIFTSDSDWDTTALEGIERNKWTDFNAYTQVFYADKKDRSDVLCKQIEQIKPDVLYIIGLYDWHFNLVPLFFVKHPHTILSVRGMLHPGALQQKWVKKKLFLKAFRLSGKHRSIRFHATDAQEAGYIRDVFGENSVTEIAANFPRLFMPVIRQDKPKGTLRLISIALISPMKNHLRVLEALKEIKQPVSYKIFGPVKDYAYWQQCLQTIGQLPDHIRVTYEHQLPPAAVLEKLREAYVAILPSESENFGHSIIEALSAGLPVISSHSVPFQNLLENRAGLNVKPEAPDLQKALEFFIQMDENEFAVWSEQAAKYAHPYVDTASTLLAYQTLFGNKEV